MKLEENTMSKVNSIAVVLRGLTELTHGAFNQTRMLSICPKITQLIKDPFDI